MTQSIFGQGLNSGCNSQMLSNSTKTTVVISSYAQYTVVLTKLQVTSAGVHSKKRRLGEAGAKSVFPLNTEDLFLDREPIRLDTSPLAAPEGRPVARAPLLNASSR